jgi:hypothetical protein
MQVSHITDNLVFLVHQILVACPAACLAYL